MITKYLTAFFLVLLFTWISFFPEPIQARAHLFTNLALIFMLLILAAKNRLSFLWRNEYPLFVFLFMISLNIFFARQKNIALKTYLDLAVPMFCIYYLISKSSVVMESNILPTAICAISIIVALDGLADFMLGVNFLYEFFLRNPFYLRYKLSTGYMPAISTQFHNPVLGSYLIASLPFSFLLTAKKEPSLKLLGFLGTILGSTAIILTLSRGIFLGFSVSILFFLFMHKKFKLLFISFAIFCLFVFLNSHMQNPFNRLGFKQLLFSGSTPIFSEYRWQRLLMALHVLKDHPFVGLGFQHFRIAFTEYYRGKGIVPQEFMIADNMYLTLLAETGFIGFTGFLVFVFAIIRNAWRKIFLMKHRTEDRFRLVIVLSAFIGLLVTMGAYELFYWVNPYLCFCILAGYISALSANTDT